MTTARKERRRLFIATDVRDGATLLPKVWFVVSRGAVEMRLYRRRGGTVYRIELSDACGVLLRTLHRREAERRLYGESGVRQ